MRPQGARSPCEVEALLQPLCFEIIHSSSMAGQSEQKQRKIFLKIADYLRTLTCDHGRHR